MNETGRARADAMRWFDELGLRRADTRPGVGLRAGLPDLLWRRVPPGSFWMGGDPLALGAWPGRSIDLTSTVFMAAYPVTVARYNSGAGPDRPLSWESLLAPVRISNHPVSVTWYEAVAFVNWLEHLRRAGSLRLPADVPEGHVIRLPRLPANVPEGHVIRLPDEASASGQRALQMDAPIRGEIGITAGSPTSMKLPTATGSGRTISRASPLWVSIHWDASRTSMCTT